MDEATSLAERGGRVLVVTDLDGTLLDHDDYSFAEVLPVLERLRGLGWPVVANTSKTEAEWLAMRGDFGNEDAFVVENGSAVIFPDGERLVLGVSREVILGHLAELRGEYQFVGFKELGVAGVMRTTGLGEAAAELASRRDYSEPLVWEDTAERKEMFCAEVKKRGLMTLEGGRFLHVLGETDKGEALAILREKEEVSCVVALGDSPNDVAMLEAADVACVIATARGKQMQVPGARRLIRSVQRGPAGWAEVMVPLLDEFSKK